MSFNKVWMDVEWEPGRWEHKPIWRPFRVVPPFVQVIEQDLGFCWDEAIDGEWDMPECSMCEAIRLKGLKLPALR